jgi:hypothetical protein
MGSEPSTSGNEPEVEGLLFLLVPTLLAGDSVGCQAYKGRSRGQGLIESLSLPAHVLQPAGGLWSHFLSPLTESGLRAEEVDLRLLTADAFQELFSSRDQPSDLPFYDFGRVRVDFIDRGFDPNICATDEVSADQSPDRIAIAAGFSRSFCDPQHDVRLGEDCSA